MEVRLSIKKVVQAQARKQPVNLSAERKWIEGLGSIDENGIFEANEVFDVQLSEHPLSPPSPHPSPHTLLQPPYVAQI